MADSNEAFEHLTPEKKAQVLEAFEAAGGQAGYDEWVSSGSQVVNPLNDNSSTTNIGIRDGGFSKWIPATMTLIPYGVGAYIDVQTVPSPMFSSTSSPSSPSNSASDDAQYHGKGFLWGLGGGVLTSVGVFWYDDWDVVKSKENRIVVGSYGDGVGGIGGWFYVSDDGKGGEEGDGGGKDGSLMGRKKVGLFVGGGGGSGIAAVGGKFTWDP